MTLSRLSLVLLLLLAPLVGAAEEEQRNPDPFEAINRPLFAVNNTLDRFIIRPVAVGYDWVMPGVAKRGVGNMFANMYDFNAAINGVLQWRLGGAAQSGGRFLVNSTLGIAGLFDVATPMASVSVSTAGFAR